MLGKSRSCGLVGCALYDARGDLSQVDDQDLNRVRAEMREGQHHHQAGERLMKTLRDRWPLLSLLLCGCLALHTLGCSSSSRDTKATTECKPGTQATGTRCAHHSDCQSCNCGVPPSAGFSGVVQVPECLP